MSTMDLHHDVVANFSWLKDVYISIDSCHFSSFASEESFAEIYGLFKPTLESQPDLLNLSAKMITPALLFSMCHALTGNSRFHTDSSPFEFLPRILACLRTWRLLTEDIKHSPHTLQQLALDVAGLVNSSSPSSCTRLPDRRQLKEQCIRQDVQCNRRKTRGCCPLVDPSCLSSHSQLAELSLSQRPKPPPHPQQIEAALYRSGCCACRRPRDIDNVIHDLQLEKLCKANSSDEILKEFSVPKSRKRARANARPNIKENIPPALLPGPVSGIAEANSKQQLGKSSTWSRNDDELSCKTRILTAHNEPHDYVTVDDQHFKKRLPHGITKAHIAASSNISRSNRSTLKSRH